MLLGDGLNGLVVAQARLGGAKRGVRLQLDAFGLAVGLQLVLRKQRVALDCGQKAACQSSHRPF